ncbi:hypothetical protein FRC06_002685, partial [Ceratobasidium sp. 370]
MSTVLCPRLVALDPSVCSSPSCRASHTHEPAFCDPCKAVHAAVHAGIHLASIGHRLRVDGPVAPVRCVVCAPLPAPPPAQFLFVGPEHYAAHARTSAHRAKLAQFPPPTRSKTKPDFGLGLGRPGDPRPFAYTRSSSTGNPYSPPASRNVTPTPAAGSRPGSSMSFNAGAGFGETPPGPPPIALEPTEYVICALCHTVLPVTPSDVAPFADSKRRNVSGGSDATVRARDDDDGSVVTTTENDTEVRKSLVLAKHMSTDTEHARRERRDAGEDERGEEDQRPVVDFASRLATANTSALTHSPDQLTLSSLSSSPSVDGLDDTSPPQAGRSGGLFFHQHHRHRRTRSVDSQGPEPEPRVRYQRDDDFVMQRQRSRSRYETSSNGSSEHRAPIRVKTQPQPQPQPQPQTQPHAGIDPPAYVREHNLPIAIPDHLLPFLSPITPSTVDPEEELERYGRSPTSQYLQALPIRALSTPIRTTFMLEPDASEGSTTPERPALVSIPEQPTPAESERVDASPSTSTRSRPYEPSPSPPPRLAFDDLGRVIKLGSFGWERQTGPMYDDLPKPAESMFAPQLPPIGMSTLGSAPAPAPVPASAPTPTLPPAPASKPVPKRASAPAPMPLPTLPDSDSDDAPERDKESDHEVRKTEEKSVVSGSVGTVQVKRYTLNRNGTDDTVREPVREGLARSGLGRSSQYTTLPARSTQFAPGRSSIDLTPGRSSTLGPNRSSGALGLTTTVTRPVAPRTSAGEWAVLGSGSGQVRFDEFGARVASGPSFGGSGTASLGARPSAGSQPWLGTGSQNGSHVRIVRSPEELSSRGSEGKTSPPYFSFKSKLHGDGSERSSPSEASQLIRGFDSPPLDLNLGTPEMLSPRRSNWTVNEDESSPEKSTTSKRSADHAPRPSVSSPARQSTSSSAPRQSAPSPTPRSTGSPATSAGPSRQFVSPTPSRPFSPTLAWNGLTPASPHHSFGSTSRSPSLSSAGEDGVGEPVGEQKPFDEEAFMNDIKFGIAMALANGDASGSRRATPSPPAPSKTPPAPSKTPPALAHVRAPAPPRPSMRPPRVSSPLARISTATPPRPISPAPRTGVSDYSVTGKTRRRARPMGTSSVVGGGGSVVGAAWGWDRSVVGGEAESVVGGGGSVIRGEEGSVVGAGEGSVVGEEGHVVDDRDELVVGGGEPVLEGNTTKEGSGVGARRDSVVSSVRTGPYAVAEPDAASPVEESAVSRSRVESLPSKAGASYADTRDEVTETHTDEVAETPTDDFGSLRPQASSVVDSPASVTALRRRVRGQSVLSSGDSEAPSSVVSPLSPRLVSALRATGMHVDPQQPPSSVEVDVVISRLAGMNIGGPTPRPSTPQRDEQLVTIERVDTASGITSPIVPPGAPSDAGSLFSRA